MSEFWYTKTTMWAVHGDGYRSFELFGATHMFWLLACFVVCIVGALLYHRAGEKARRRAIIVLTVLLLADELLKYVFTLATGQFEWQFLPFHMCSINLFVCLWYTLRPNQVAGNILYALCLPGAFVALIFPSWQALPIFNMMHLHSETVHIMLVLYPVLLLAGGFRPDVKQLPKAFGFLLGAGVLAMCLNKLWGTNFMFLARTDGISILEAISSVFGSAYILGLVCLVIIVWAVLYAPWIISERRRHPHAVC